jgi:hypothetical protein
LLEEAGITEEAIDVVFAGMDRGVEGDIPQRYERALPPEELRRGEAMLAWAMNGHPLLPQHGFPVRLVVPGWYGMTAVKWLAEIIVLDQPFVGYQNVKGYRFRQDPDEEGVPVSRLAVRSLMVPPGVPEFQSRDRVVEAGRCPLEGRAWSGVGPITRVEVSADGGRTWAEATVETASGTFGWSRWTFDWTAEPGEHVLCCRATDSEGRTQPLETLVERGRLRQQRRPACPGHRDLERLTSKPAAMATPSATASAYPIPRPSKKKPLRPHEPVGVLGREADQRPHGERQVGQQQQGDDPQDEGLPEPVGEVFGEHGGQADSHAREERQPEPQQPPAPRWRCLRAGEPDLRPEESAVRPHRRTTPSTTKSNLVKSRSADSRARAIAPPQW